MQEKVLVLDIDGTLTNSKKEITEATKQGIWNILQHGHKVILASGRPTPGMRKCEEELELKKYGGYLLSFNGARIVECKTGEVVYQRTLPLSHCARIVRIRQSEWLRTDHLSGSWRHLCVRAG